MKHNFKKTGHSIRYMAVLFFMLFSGLANAAVTGISVVYNGLSLSLSPIKTFGATSQVEIFSGSSAKFKLTGSWIDITSSIKLVALDGQATTNVSISKTSNSLPGVSPAVLEFVIDKTLTGRYRVEMVRNGGSDRITVRFNQKPLINSITPLTLAGTPAYLNAFAINSDIRIRISGSFISNLTLDNDRKYTIVNQNFVANTSGLKECVIKVPVEDDNFTLRSADFSITYGSTSFDLLDLAGFAFKFPVYNRPNLKIEGVLTNLYKKTNFAVGSCSINNNTMAVIPNPTRCATTFAVPNPTTTAPLSQKIVSMPAPSITIRNNSFAPVLTPFTVEFRFGLTVLQSVTVSKMIAGEVKTITYTRPESRKLLYRSVNCPDCYEDPGVPYNWEDPNITVVIDPSPGVTTGPGIIAEYDEGDNSATFNQ